MSLPSRIFLIGLPGSGKTTVGKGLASELNYQFLDLDDLIERATDKYISDIFSEKGEDQFRQIESSELRKINQENIVVATGGGAPCFHENMAWMNENGFTIFLNQPLELIAERVAKGTHRPLITKDPLDIVGELFKKRESYYKQAIMESSLSEPHEIMAELLNSYSSS